MPSMIAPSLRLFCVAAFLLFSVVRAADPASALRGATRDQVIRQMGEPRSQMAVGNRLVMLYPQERVVFRDGVVVDVEPIWVEPARRAPAPATSPTLAAGEQAAAASAAAPTAAPTTAAVKATPVPPNAEQPIPPAAEATPAVPPAEPAPEPKLEIKLVRPPSSGRSPQPAPWVPAPTPPLRVRRSPAPTPVAPTPEPATVPPSVSPAPEQSLAAKTAIPAVPPAPAAPETAPRQRTPDVPPVAESEVRPPEAAPALEEKSDVEDRAERKEELAAEKDKKAKVIQAARRRLNVALDNAEPDPTPSIFSLRTYLIAFVTVVGGIGYLVWRGRQRQWELAATAVSQTPFSSSVASPDSGGAQFSADLFSKIEWKRFEELVEAYYSKTGVVAERVKGGPSRPAQVKISWKGEPRPFAYVRCIFLPAGLIEVKPLQELYTLLAAEDIRRGYIVTTGKFTVSARDFAEEKHLTLLPGEIFLEKLNALPGAARTEIMQAVTAGEAATPSCPICEAKMALSNDDPPMWRCASHPDIIFPS